MDKSIQKSNAETNSKICNTNRNRRILIVDDEPDFCKITALGLTKLSYDVLTATDGRCDIC